MKGFSRDRALLSALAFAMATSAYSAPAPQAPTSSRATPAVGKQGDVGEQNVVGKNKEKLEVGKFDPPAAFNLEDIQNFPEDRLLPVLHNPLVFEEGRDFATLMDFQEEQLYHPWLPEIAHAPFLTMKTDVEKSPVQEWTFSIIDQAGATVAKQDGKGSPPAALSWAGQDGVRDHIAVETVYIPQLATTDRQGYHHTFMGQPIQFASLVFNDNGHPVIEISSKRLFQEKKSEWTKEAPVLLDKVVDVLREQGQHPFTVQPFDADSGLGTERQKAVKDYLAAHLHIAADQISTPSTQDADKRGEAIVISNGGSGGAS